METVQKSIQQTLEIEGQSILNIFDTLDVDALETVVDWLSTNQGHTITLGCGTSGAAAKKMAHTLNCVDCPTTFVSPADAPHGALGTVREGDIAILLSKGGNTNEIVQLLPSLKAKGARIIAITENENSKLAQGADVLLKIKTEKEPDPFNMLATASILTTLAVMDAITICVMQRNGFSLEKFAVIHPSGAVGDRLLNKKD